MIHRIFEFYLSRKWPTCVTASLLGLVLGMLLSIGLSRAAEPDEATKRAALLWAYQANGNSMTSWTAWDYEKKTRLEVYPRDVTPKAKPDTLLKGDRNGQIRMGQ